MPLLFHCGIRKAGWLGSFQIAKTDTCEPNCRPTAVMNSWKSRSSGRVMYGALWFEVAHRGTGEVTVSSTGQPRRINQPDLPLYFEFAHLHLTQKPHANLGLHAHPRKECYTLVSLHHLANRFHSWHLQVHM